VDGSLTRRLGHQPGIYRPIDEEVLTAKPAVGLEIDPTVASAEREKPCIRMHCPSSAACSGSTRGGHDRTQALTVYMARTQVAETSWRPYIGSSNPAESIAARSEYGGVCCSM